MHADWEKLFDEARMGPNQLTALDTLKHELEHLAAVKKAQGEALMRVVQQRERVVALLDEAGGLITAALDLADLPHRKDAICKAVSEFANRRDKILRTFGQ